MRQVKLNNREAARLTIKEVLLFQEKAKIPTKHIKDCVVKRKNCMMSGENCKSHQKIKYFKSNFDNLFDIAHQDAFTNTTEKDRQFLLLQRKKRRPDCMEVVDIKSVKEQRKETKRATKMTRL